MPITPDTLRKYKNGTTFVETGCEDGNGIQAALDAGFRDVVSIEIDPKHVYRARSRFARRPVTVLQGDTTRELSLVLETISEPSTFWLDAHPCGASPILLELAALREHPIKTHTILIDDRRLMHGPWVGVTEEAVKFAIWSINPNYEITLADGYVSNDIIVAQVK
jgi:hypothetical protein